MIIYVRIAKAHRMERGNARNVSVSGNQTLTSLAKSRKIFNKFVTKMASSSFLWVNYVFRTRERLRHRVHCSVLILPKLTGVDTTS